jgi:hypothetical protein
LPRSRAEGRRDVRRRSDGSARGAQLDVGDGGVGATLTPEIIERAVRHGVGHDGRALRIMPSDDFQYLSDDDTRAVIAYVQHVAR